uniref:FAD-dependent oxidoreductase domain-containing protein 1 n=1 Tax=Oncorhynchus tshawytscha TaxID=74940 RepID=A0A8C8J306_ONCTS
MSMWKGLHMTARAAHGIHISSRFIHKHMRLCTRNISTSRPVQNDFFKDLENQFKAFREKAADAMPGSDWTPFEKNSSLPPERADIVIVGGGVVGWSIAYWLKQKEMIRDGVRVLVVERDPTYSQASTVLSAGGIRQQFSLPENIHLSMASADFMRNINEHLSVLNDDPVDLQFNHSGYLFLASEKVAHIMEENYSTQRYAGAKVSLLSPTQLKEKCPWINTDGVVLASYADRSLSRVLVVCCCGPSVTRTDKLCVSEMPFCTPLLYIAVISLLACTILAILLRPLINKLFSP